MDIEDYYFRTKNSKQRKYEGSSRRKGHTIRSTGQGRQGKPAVEVVTKTIRTTKHWDEKRINDYCENVLEDGGIPAHVLDYLNNGLSMKKQKRWALSDKIREAMYDHIDDEQAPDVLLVERAVVPGDSYTMRGCRANVTRATYVASKPMGDTNGTSETKEESGQRKIVDRKPSGKHGYSYPEDLAGYPVMRYHRRRRDENERPEVTYDFCYASPPDRAPGDCTSTKPYTYKFDTKKENYLDQIDEYYYSQKHGIDWTRDNDDDEDLDPQDGEVGEVQIERSNEVLFDSLIRSRKSDANKMKKRRKPRQTSLNETEELGGKGMKGKVVKMEESENLFPSHEEVQENISPLMKFSFEIGKSALMEFCNAQIKRVDQNFVEIANLRPITFTVDLRPHPLNELRNEACHLVFQTGFDPDAYEEVGLGEDVEDYLVDITMFCGNEEFSKLICGHLQQSFENMQSIRNASDLDEFIRSAKRTVEDVWPDTKEYYSLQEPQNLAKEGGRVTTTTREVRRERISLTIKGISEHVGLDPEYSSLVELLPNDILLEREGREFEMTSDPSAGKECNKCKKRFNNLDEKGLALVACRHWFCKSCWAKHMLKSDEYFPKCIEMDCRARANLAAKLVFCSLTRNRNSMKLWGKLGNKIAHKCSVSTCNHVTMVRQSTKPLVLWCPCKRTRCGDCGADPHWPASCRAARRYAVELNLLKRKALFESVKLCPRCGEVTLSEEPKGRDWHRPEFDSGNNCWNAPKEHSPFFTYKRLPHWTHCWGAIDQAPSQGLFFVDGFQLVKESAVANHEVFRKYHDAIWNNEFDNRARSRGIDYLTEEGRQDLMTVVDDLILVKNEVYYVLLFTHVTLRYDQAPKSSQRKKFLIGMSKKMETLVERINYLLYKRDYKGRDPLFPTTYQSLAVKGRKLLKDLFQATAKEK